MSSLTHYLLIIRDKENNFCLIGRLIKNKVSIIYIYFDKDTWYYLDRFWF